MGMAGQAGGANMQNLYQMGAQQQAAQQQILRDLLAAQKGADGGANGVLNGSAGAGKEAKTAAARVM